MKHEAYYYLARIGGDAGLKAVLSHRAKPLTLSSFADYMQLDKLGTKPDPDARVMAPLISVHSDARRVLWGLVSSGAIGSSGDLWIIHYNGKHWVDPVFTGVDISTRRYSMRSNHKAPDKFSGLSEADLLKSGWFSKFVGNAELTRDSVGDGFTDLVRGRLGLQPGKKSSKRAEAPAGRNSNLLTNVTPEADVEKVLAVAFEGRFRYAEDDVPCVIEMPDGVRPIQFNGWGWIVLAVRNRVASPVSEFFEEGMASIRMYKPVFNNTHTEAGVSISTYYRGLDGNTYYVRLRKFDSEWVVISCMMTSIS